DYHEFATLEVHRSFEALLAARSPKRMFALSSSGSRSPYDTRFESGDWLVFGCETRGLPAELLAGFPPDQRLRLPMRPGNRSLNLSNAVAVTVFEGWRQLGFPGAQPAPGGADV